MRAFSILAFALVPAFADPAPELGKWQPLFRGVEQRLDVTAAPRPMRVHQVRIDTRAEGISFFTTPGNGDAPGEVTGRRTATFLKEFGLEVAVNGTGFKPITSEGRPVDVLGLSISDGTMVSEVDLTSGNPIFLVTAKNQARILRAPFRQEDWADADDALVPRRLKDRLERALERVLEGIVQHETDRRAQSRLRPPTPRRGGPRRDRPGPDERGDAAAGGGAR
jgi:hypothetical protein